MMPHYAFICIHLITNGVEHFFMPSTVICDSILIEMLILLNSKSYLYILDTSSIRGICFAHILSNSEIFSILVLKINEKNFRPNFTIFLWFMACFSGFVF